MAFGIEIHFPFLAGVMFYVFIENQNLQSHTSKLENRLEIKTLQIVIIKNLRD